jgi:Domain of unknown function (DUF4136)
MPFTQSMRAQSAIILVAIASLAGCSGMRLVDSDVTAFSAWTATPPGPNTRYRFERLPSQVAAVAEQASVEAVATTSLAKVGLVLSPTEARYAVQVIAATEVLQRYSDSGFGVGGPGVFIGGGNLGGSVGLSFPFGFSTPYYKRSVTVLMRELATQKVVFETRAVNDGPSGDFLAVLPAMLDSALLGFPQPPTGTRRVNVEIPR